MTRRRKFWLWAFGLGCVTATAVAHEALRANELVLGPSLALRAPQYLALCCLLPLMAAASELAATGAPAWHARLSATIRACVLICVAVALSRPARLLERQQLSVVFAVDVSDSLDAAARARAQSFVQAAHKQRADNHTALIQFAGSARTVRDIAELGSNQAMRAAGAAQETDLQAAVRFAYTQLAADHAARVVLLTDGRQTQGTLDLEAALAARLGVQLDYVLLSGRPPAEVGVSALWLPESIEVGRGYQVQCELFSSQSSEARVMLFQGDRGAAAPRELHLAPGTTRLEFPAIARMAGPIAYRVELQPHTADAFAANNQASASGYVHGRARVLLIDPDPPQIVAVSQMLLQHEFDTEVRTDLAAPRTLNELDAYDFVIVSDAALERLPRNFPELLERYVRDGGGGVLVSGGDHSFGLGGYQRTRFQQLLPVRMAGEVQHDDHTLALSLLIDSSGSMAGTKIDLAKEAARATVEVLSDDDLIEVIGFAGEPDRQVRMQSARNRVGVMQSIARLVAQGGTQLFPALDLAYQDLAAARARLKHVILLTDGQTQETGIEEVVQAMRSENITVSVVGLGRDVNHELLQTVAGLGAGRAYFTDDPHNVPRIFVHETTAQKRNSAVERPTRLRVRTPAECLRGLDMAQAPAIRGYVSTQPKPSPAQVLLESETGEPLLARQRVGLGFALAFTPDLKARWTADLLRWPHVDRLLAQVVREHVREPHVDAFPMTVEVRAGRAHIAVEARDREQRFLHGLISEVQVLGSQPVATTLREVAPGRYEGDLALPEFGTFGVLAAHSRDGAALGESYAQARNPYPPEYLPGPADAALLARASDVTGGRALTDPAAAFRPAQRTQTVKHDLWSQVTWLALALWLADVLVRRLRPMTRGRASSRAAGAG